MFRGIWEDVQLSSEFQVIAGILGFLLLLSTMVGKVVVHRVILRALTRALQLLNNKLVLFPIIL